jgi:hypothetical protein
MIHKRERRSEELRLTRKVLERGAQGMTRKLGVLGALLVAVILMVSTPALGDAPAWEFTAVGLSGNTGAGFSLGEVFVPTANITVDFLGYYGSAFSFAESHNVAIYDATGTLLDSTTIDNTSFFVTTNFVYNFVTPITLLAGQTYVIDGASGLVDPYAYNDIGFTVFAPVNLLGDNFTPGNNANFTGTTPINDVTDGYWGPNFGWTASTATPEPGTLGLLIVGGLSFLGKIRRRYI